MEWTSIIAIYVLFWVLSAFIILPIGIRSHFETGEEMLAGQADGAPSNFRPLQILWRTTALATATFVLFYLNYIYGWISVDDIDLFGARERL